MAAEKGGNLANRRAIEALRNGVPNSDAVRILGCRQPEAEHKFNDLLAEASNGDRVPKGSLGMLVSGEFGAGKSHLLTYLQHLALERGFVCSRVAISKETPLFKLDKVFISAADSAVVPGRKGRLIEELDLCSKLDSKAYGNFYGWVANADRLGRLSGMFHGSLVAYEISSDLELKGRIEAFWAGNRISAPEIKSELRRNGKPHVCAFRTPRLSELPSQRLRFVLEMIKGAGYKGWVVLLDEVELVGSYSRLQRGRAYAELARWMGQADAEAYPGLVAVGTVTEDFAAVVISPDGRKKDGDYIVPALRNRPRDEGIADLAAAGMRLLEGECIPLRPPTLDEVGDAVERIRQLYSEVYGWEAPELQASRGGTGTQRRMRYKVRAAINEWDLRRLCPDAQPVTLTDEFRHRYEASAGLEQEFFENADD